MMTLNAKALAQYDIAHGQNMSNFINRQPEEVKNILNQIFETSKDERCLIESGHIAVSKARAELQKLKPYHDKYAEEVKNANAIYNQAAKSEANHKYQEERLEQIRAKSGETSMEYQTQQDKVNQALKQKDADALSKAQKEEAMKSITQNYKEQYFNCILGALQIIAEAREQAYHGRIGIGEKISNLANELVQPDDPSIATLEEELSRLENITIE